MCKRDISIHTTGPLHIGGVRTALYNYLFARQHGGELVFRIEDTDSHRFVPGAEEYILKAFKWLGIKFDEGVSFGGKHGPYRQSERRDIYKKYVDQLLEAGKAYYAFDTPEELEAKRAEVKNFQYDATTRLQMRNSLTMPEEQWRKLIDDGVQYTVRFKVEPGQEIHVNDMIRGDVCVKSDILDDKVLYKSADELPTHLPLLLKPEGKGKLSKRDGDRLGFPVFPLEWHDPKTGEVSSGYRESGYFPEAVVNFLALLGWNPGTDQEIFSLDELVKAFDITKCSKSGAKFDYQKGIWFNHEYILRKSDDEIARLFAPIVANNGVDESFDRVKLVVHMMKDRVSFVKELWPLCSFFFIAPTEYDEKTVRKRWKEFSAQQMSELIDVLEGIDDFSVEGQEPIVEKWIADKGYKMGDVMNAFRLALVGIGKGPGMFDISAFLGKEETIKRLRKAIATLSPDFQK